MRAKVPCSFCGKDVAITRPGAHRLVEGWEKVRGIGDGVFPLKDRQVKGRYCHDLCLDIHLKGGQQESML